MKDNDDNDTDNSVDKTDDNVMVYRIVGGYATEEYQFPWMAAVLKVEPEGGNGLSNRPLAALWRVLLPHLRGHHRFGVLDPDRVGGRTRREE